MGSPPPTRGKVTVWLFSQTNDRITPAYAGKSCLSRLHLPPPSDHPRLRGEKWIDASMAFALQGSPPPTRGKGTFTFVRCKKSKDHPRLRGEKFAEVYIHKTESGSPPPTRGKGNRKSRTVCGYGITPAYAGKSDCAFTVLCEIKDHPRLRGEKTKKIP